MNAVSRRRFVLGSVAASAAAAWPASAHARSGLSAKVGADRTKLQVGEEFVLELGLERSDGGGGVPSPELPSEVEENFDVLQCLPRSATNLNMFNGRATRSESRSLRCVLAARKEGTFEVAFTIRDGGSVVKSNRIQLVVEGTSEPEIADPSQTEPVEPQGDVFLWASVDRARAFVGEQITYSLDVYEARRFLDPHLRTPPTFQDFFSEELEVGQPRITNVGNRRYRVRPAIRRALFPQKAGTLMIGAAEITIGLRAREQSAALAVEVSPLPAAGQPPGFSPNNVGSYDIAARVDRTEVAAGEPFTLTVEISGRGNIDVIDAGEWPGIDGVRRYDPKIETRRDDSDVVGGARTYEFLMIPQRPGTLEIPAYGFSFFDPGLETYQTVKTQPLRVEVTGQAIAIEEASEVVEDRAAELDPVLAFDAVPRVDPPERWLDPARWRVAMVAAPVVAGVGLGASTLWRRFGPDDAARKRAQTRARRREQIDTAQASVASGDGFHAVVGKLLQDVALDRAGPDGVGLPRGRLIALLVERGVDRGDLQRLESLFEACDAARFAAQRGTESERRALLDEALALVRRSSLAGEGG